MGYLLEPDKWCRRSVCCGEKVVFDLDRQGNKGYQIWQGRINQGESVKITTPHARFIYDYNDQPDDDQPLSGGSDRWCNNLETILVP